MLGRPVGELQQRLGEELPAAEELLKPVLEVLVEEASVLGHEHGGEDPERVGRQLGAVQGTKGRRDDRDRLGVGVAQVVETTREHLECAEDAGHLRHLARRAERIAPCRSAVTRSMLPSRSAPAPSRSSTRLFTSWETSTSEVYAGTSVP